ncbi:MAG TPA: hypothetical protein VGE02_16955 [Gemmatimonadales bacterium]
MNDEQLRRLYQQAIAARESRGGTACDVSPEEMLALAREELPEEQRMELLDRVMRSERCRGEFELLRAVVVAGRAMGGADDEDDGGTRDDVVADVVPLDPERRARQGEARRPVPWWRRGSLPMALAATALVAVGVSRFLGDGASPVDVTRGAADGVSVIAPTPATRLAPGARPTFVWHAVPGASRYGFELLDADGNLLHDAVTADTSVVLPPDVTLAADTDYRWIVRATDALGAQLGSAVSQIRVE